MPSRRIKVLVVDDDPRIQKSIWKLLVAWGYVIEVAGDGRKALEKVRLFKPRAIIADMRMPEVGGLDLVQTLSRETAQIHFILISGCASSHELTEAMRCGVSGFLEKPFEPQRLRNELEKYLT